MAEETRGITYEPYNEPNAFGWEWKAFRVPRASADELIGWGATKEIALQDLLLGESGAYRGPRPEAVKIG